MRSYHILSLLIAGRLRHLSASCFLFSGQWMNLCQSPVSSVGWPETHGTSDRLLCQQHLQVLDYTNLENFLKLIGILDQHIGLYLYWEEYKILKQKMPGQYGYTILSILVIHHNNGTKVFGVLRIITNKWIETKRGWWK